MYFTKKEKILIGIIVLSIALLSFFKIFNPTSKEDDLIVEELGYNIEGEKIEVDSDETELVLESEEENIIIHIAGAVKSPGVLELKSGSRVIDAIELSGGLKEDACLDSINLARKLNDEEKVYIAKVGEEVSEDIILDDTSSSSSSIVNINNCTKEELMTLPGIGDKTAEKILLHREENIFKIIEDIMKVPGIGEKKFEAIKDSIKTK